MCKKKKKKKKRQEAKLAKKAFVFVCMYLDHMRTSKERGGMVGRWGDGPLWIKGTNSV